MFGSVCLLITKNLITCICFLPYLSDFCSITFNINSLSQLHAQHYLCLLVTDRQKNTSDWKWSSAALNLRVITFAARAQADRWSLPDLLSLFFAKLQCTWSNFAILNRKLPYEFRSFRKWSP